MDIASERVQVTQVIDIVASKLHDTLDLTPCSTGAIWLSGDVTDSVCNRLDVGCYILVYHAIRRSRLFEELNHQHEIPSRSLEDLQRSIEYSMPTMPWWTQGLSHCRLEQNRWCLAQDRPLS